MEKGQNLPKIGKGQTKKNPSKFLKIHENPVTSWRCYDAWEVKLWFLKKKMFKIHIRFWTIQKFWILMFKIWFFNCSKSTFLFLDFWDFSILNNFKALTRIYHNFSRLSPILTGQKRIERGDSQLSIRFFLVKIRHHLEQIWWIRVGALKLFKIEKSEECKNKNVDFEHFKNRTLNI